MSGISSTSELSYTASYSNCVCEYDLGHNDRYQTYMHAAQGLHFQVARKQQNYIHVLHESVHEYKKASSLEVNGVASTLGVLLELKVLCRKAKGFQDGISKFFKFSCSSEQHK